MRKLEIVHGKLKVVNKEVESCLISYNLRLACVKDFICHIMLVMYVAEGHVLRYLCSFHDLHSFAG